MAIGLRPAHGRLNMREKSTGDCKQKPGVIAPVVDLKRCEGRGRLRGGLP